MSILGQSAGLIFKIDGDSSALQKELKGVDAAFSSIGSKLGTLGGVATVGAAAFAALGTAAVAGTAALFNLTRQAAEYGSAIFDAKEKTGLSAATLSTLKLSADNAGSSLEQVTSSTAKFAKTLGEARDGNEKAQQKLKELNVTTYDLDEALSQATQTIFNAKEGTDQIVLAQKAFGKSGADLLPVIKQLGGDLAGATEEAERLGLTLSEKDVAASDAFGDALGMLSAQAKVAAVAFTSELMPILTEFFISTSEWYAENKDTVKNWGTMTAYFVSGVAAHWRDATNAISDYMAESRALGKSPFSAGGVSSVPWWAYALGAGGLSIMAKGERESKAGKGARPFGTWGPQRPRGATSSSGPGSDPTGADNPIEVSGISAEDQAKADFQNRVAELRRQLAEAEAVVDRLIASAQLALEQGIISETEFAEKKIALTELTENRKLTALRRELDAAKQYGQETVEIESRITIQREQIQTVHFNNLTSRQKEVSAARKEYEDALKKYDEDEKKRHEEWKERVADENAQHQQRLNNIKAEWDAAEAEREQERAKAAAAAEQDRIKGTVGGLGGFEGLQTAINKNLKGTDMTAATAGLQVMASAFSQLGQGAGEALRAFALFGSAGIGLRKFAAEMVASIAQMAAVQAIWELAQGFAMLAQNFFWPAPHLIKSAIMHFKSAAIYGGIAGIAAVAGRGVAGDSFNQQTDRATGGSSSSASNNRSANGQVHSGQEGTVVENGANSPISRGLASNITLTIKTTKDHIVEVVKSNIAGNGSLRTAIQDAAV